MSQPLIDSARLKFSGISQEDFEDIPAIGETRTFTIRAQCTKHIEEQMANEGIRKVANMRISKIVSGVDKSIEDKEGDEPSLFDTDPADEPDEPEDDREQDAEEDEGASVSSIGTGFTGGPQFSAGDDE
ncbi:hypothetical protein LRM64_10140 [Prescottella equi]|uniref:DUF7171 family protein n=1 Tax=Rhodococcus hoagii TaxID=43767 RepID=UPI001A021C21|nr:hypothetical protein [Prescottella equi]MBM4592256.1 hypothetical protein [Prescottella equi]MBM4596121.1 hypothetical protein [Prescottella equi]MCU7531906.1 hypothetical protein [Prescottella equi]MCU7534038.1 hypothetical protein [Prescottella equi]NKW13287.1 hypothetical protein [Prescottella equi]